MDETSSKKLIVEYLRRNPLGLTGEDIGRGLVLSRSDAFSLLALLEAAGTVAKQNARGRLLFLLTPKGQAEYEQGVSSAGGEAPRPAVEPDESPEETAS